jgi:methionyl-tRNA formyltransferase
MAKPLRIIFMGTPQFAVPSLEALTASDHRVVAVITAPDKPSGRGQVLTPSPVKEFALVKGITVLQPANLKDPDFLRILETLKADLQVVVAFRMLPEVVWKMPALGTINLHASLLPQYRGAAPINRAIMSGEKETGVTTFFINENIDRGAILFKETMKIADDDDAGSLHDKLMETGARLLVKTLDAIALGDVKPVQQDTIVLDMNRLKPAPKIFKEDCRIDWEKSSVEIHNLIRGLSPYPAAFTKIRISQKSVIVMKIFKSHVLPCVNTEDFLPVRSPGTVITDQKRYLNIACADGLLSITELQIEGKRRMPVAEFLRGFRFEEGCRVE